MRVGGSWTVVWGGHPPLRDFQTYIHLRQSQTGIEYSVVYFQHIISLMPLMAGSQLKILILYVSNSLKYNYYAVEYDIMIIMIIIFFY